MMCWFMYWLIWVIMTSYSYNTLIINWNYVCKKMRLQAVCPGLFIFIVRVIFGVSWSLINRWFYYDYFITQIIISKLKLYMSMYLQQLYNAIFQTQQYIITAFLSSHNWDPVTVTEFSTLKYIRTVL